MNPFDPCCDKLCTHKEQEQDRYSKCCNCLKLVDTGRGSHAERAHDYPANLFDRCDEAHIGNPCTVYRWMLPSGTGGICNFEDTAVIRAGDEAGGVYVRGLFVPMEAPRPVDDEQAAADSV